MPNIAFNYLYRDAANYKNFGTVIFANPNNRTPQELTALLRPLLFDEEFFSAPDWGIPDKSPMGDFPYKWNAELDHYWHEFESFEYTEEAPTDKRSVEEFLQFTSPT